MKNESSQTLIHIATIYGAIKCLSYIIYFNLISPDEKDNQNASALFYAITRLQTEETKHKSILAMLLRITNIPKVTPEGVDLFQLMTDWQRELFYNYKDFYIPTD